MLALLLFAISCENEGEKVYLSGLDMDQLLLTETDVVLHKEDASKVVLSAAWKNSVLMVSNPNMGAPNVLRCFLQLSTEEDFSSNVVEVESAGESKAFTGLELNSLSKNLGLESDVATLVYVRLRASVGANIESSYSEIKTVRITPYSIDMSMAFILDANKNRTGQLLASPNTDGIYSGFIGAASWGSFLMEEGDGTVWGNLPQDGTAFYISSQADSWSLWYPEPSGCYFTEVNTVRKVWSAISLPSITVSGDIEGEMTYDRATNKWTYIFNATETGISTIRLSGLGDLYNTDTGDSAPASDKVTIAFGPGAEGLVRTDAPQDIQVEISVAGESTLVLDLSDPKQWKCEVEAGAEEPETVYSEIFLMGIDDGITEAWNFDTTLPLHNQEELQYVGIANVNSLWGYKIGVENGNWSEVYALGEGSSQEGTLIFQGENNIPAPEQGIYFFDISLKALTYKLTSIGNQIYVTGLDDNWAFTDILEATSQPGVYSGTFTVAGPSSYGFKIYMENGNWDVFLGGSEGRLLYKGGDIPDSKDWTAGTYTIKVDLLEGTYSIE